MLIALNYSSLVLLHVVRQAIPWKPCFKNLLGVYVYTTVQHSTVYFVKLTNVLENGIVYDYRGQCYLVVLILLIIAIQMAHVIIVV